MVRDEEKKWEKIELPARSQQKTIYG